MSQGGRVRVVAYGSLRLGGSRSAVFRGMAVPTDTALTGYRLFDTGRGFPIAVPDETGTIVVTVWTAIDDPAGDRILALLDDIEGVPQGLFRRVLADVAGAEAVIYVPGQRLLDTIDDMAPIASGDWIAEREARSKERG